MVSKTCATCAYFGSDGIPECDIVPGLESMRNSTSDCTLCVPSYEAMKKYISDLEAKLVKEMERYQELKIRAETAEKERDAYKKAKQENDERFMNERDRARFALEEMIANSEIPFVKAR